MIDYRLYFLNRTSGHIEDVLDLQAVTDKGALALARDHAGTRPLELWCGGHKLAHIDATDVLSKTLFLWGEARPETDSQTSEARLH